VARSAVAVSCTGNRASARPDWPRHCWPQRQCALRVYQQFLGQSVLPMRFPREQDDPQPDRYVPGQLSARSPAPPAPTNRSARGVQGLVGRGGPALCLPDISARHRSQALEAHLTDQRKLTPSRRRPTRNRSEARFDHLRRVAQSFAITTGCRNIVLVADRLAHVQPDRTDSCRRWHGSCAVDPALHRHRAIDRGPADSKATIIVARFSPRRHGPATASRRIRKCVRRRDSAPSSPSRSSISVEPPGR